MWLDLTKIAMTWLDSRLEYFWLDLTCDSSKGDLLQHWKNVLTRDSSTFDLTWLVTRARVTCYNTGGMSWLATRVLLTRLDLWLEQGWLVTTLEECLVKRGKRLVLPGLEGELEAACQDSACWGSWRDSWPARTSPSQTASRALPPGPGISCHEAVDQTTFMP